MSKLRVGLHPYGRFKRGLFALLTSSPVYHRFTGDCIQVLDWFIVVTDVLARICFTSPIVVLCRSRRCSDSLLTFRPYNLRFLRFGSYFGALLQLDWWHFVYYSWFVALCHFWNSSFMTFQSSHETFSKPFHPYILFTTLRPTPEFFNQMLVYQYNRIFPPFFSI